MKQALYRLELDYSDRKASALTRFRYIARRHGYADHPDQLLHLESGNLQEAGIGGDVECFWEGADRYSREGGRRFFEVRIALPRDLHGDRQIALAVACAKAIAELTNLTGHRMPYSVAVHAGHGRNPHAHILISPAMNDGITRKLPQWFRRFNSKLPGKGGAPKLREIVRKRWLLAARRIWEEIENRMLHQWGTGLQVDRRSLRDQGSRRIPSLPLGPMPRPGRPNPGRELRRRRNLEIEEENRRREQERQQQLHAAEERRINLNRRAHEAFAQLWELPLDARSDCRCDILDIDKRRRAGLTSLVRNREFQEMTRRDLGKTWDCGVDPRGVVWLHPTELPIFDFGDHVVAAGTSPSSALAAATLLARRTAGNIERSGPPEWRRQVGAAWRHRSELIARPREPNHILAELEAIEARAESRSGADGRDAQAGQLAELLDELLHALESGNALQRKASVLVTRLG